MYMLYKILLGWQYSVFHGSNCQCHHSSPRIQKGNCSRGDHGHTQTSLDEEACADSSAHILALNNEDAKGTGFGMIKNKIKS